MGLAVDKILQSFLPYQEFSFGIWQFWQFYLACKYLKKGKQTNKKPNQKTNKQKNLTRPELMYIFVIYLQALIGFYYFSVQLISYPLFYSCVFSFILSFYFLLSCIQEMWNYSAAEGNMQSRKSLLDLFGQNINIKWFELDKANPTLALDWSYFSFSSSDSPPSMMFIPIHGFIFLFTWTLKYLNVSSVWAVPLVPSSLWNSNFCPHNTYLFQILQKYLMFF